MNPACKRFLPRPYQEKAVREVLSLYQDEVRKMLLHLPTGSGKTVIATLIIERLLPLIDSGKMLFIAHRSVPCAILGPRPLKSSLSPLSASIPRENAARFRYLMAEIEMV